MKKNNIKLSECRRGGGEDPNRGPGDRDWEWRWDRFGPEGLTNRELICCVLGPGGPVAATEAAGRLLDTFSGLGELAAERPAALARGFGLGPARTTRLLAAFELGFRAGGPPRRAGFTVRSPADVPREG